MPDNPTGSTTKSVTFIPLSPQSSRTLRKHHESQDKADREASVAAAAAAAAAAAHDNARDPSPARDESIQDSPPRRPRFHRRRSDSDPSSDRPVIQRRRRRGYESPLSDEENAIEDLPDRFDAKGRPLDPTDPRRLHSRRGEFEYRPRDGGGGTHVEGAWGVQGTDPEMVNRVAQGVGNLLQGRQGWMGVLGNVLSSLPGPSSGDDHGGGGGSSSGRRRGTLEYHRDDEDDDDYDDDRRRRRHRRRRDDDS